jgi:hypothetical protein
MERLKGASVDQVGLQPQLLKPFGNELRRPFKPLRTDATALHDIVGEEGDVSLDS